MASRVTRPGQPASTDFRRCRRRRRPSWAAAASNVSRRRLRDGFIIVAVTFVLLELGLRALPLVAGEPLRSLVLEARRIPLSNVRTYSGFSAARAFPQDADVVAPGRLFFCIMGLRGLEIPTIVHRRSPGGGRHCHRHLGHRVAPQGGQLLQRPLPVPRREDPVVQRHARSRVLPLLRLRRGRRRVQVRRAAGEGRLPGGGAPSRGAVRDSDSGSGRRRAARKRGRARGADQDPRNRAGVFSRAARVAGGREDSGVSRKGSRPHAGDDRSAANRLRAAVARCAAPAPAEGGLLAAADRDRAAW